MRIEEMKKEAQELAAQSSKQTPTTQPNNILQENNSSSEAPVEVSIEHKLDILKRLYDLSQHGIQLCKNYGIDSDYREMVWEYNMHVNNIRQQQENTRSQALQHQQMHQNVLEREVTTTPQNSVVAHQESELEKQQKELINQQLQQLKKQEQIRKVQELNKLNYALQTDQIYKLQQLRNMQRMRENAEKQRSNHKNYGNRMSEDSGSEVDSDGNDRRRNNRKYHTKN